MKDSRLVKSGAGFMSASAASATPRRNSPRATSPRAAASRKRRSIEDVLEENEQLIDDLEVLAAEVRVR